MWKERLIAISLIFAGLFIGYFDYASEGKLSQDLLIDRESSFPLFPIKLGLDLKGGTHLIYQADLSDIADSEIKDSMNALRDVIERRVNIFGVSEPLVQTETIGKIEDKIGRLIVELPGVTDVDEAIALIGATPVLDFRIESQLDINDNTIIIGEDGVQDITIDDLYEKTELTGRYLVRANLEFSSISGEPIVSLSFDKDGAKLFKIITEENIGRTVAIYLDGSIISAPVVQSIIENGQAQITGEFTREEAKILVGRLNSGALPIPIELLSNQTIGASLGSKAVEQGIKAGIVGLILVAIFFILWYRLPGVLAVISLGIYLVLMFALFKIIPITLTAAGVAGFILTIGLAVDANILIFERIKEELAKKEQEIKESIGLGFSRAWLSIRDANLSSIITAVILFWFGTSLIKGFALTFGIGVLISMFSSIVVTRIFIMSVGMTQKSGLMGFLMGSGIKKSTDISSSTFNKNN